MKKSVEKLQLRVTLQGLEDAAMDEQGYKTITLDMESILFIFYNTYKKKLYKTNNKLFLKILYHSYAIAHYIYVFIFTNGTLKFRIG